VVCAAAKSSAAAEISSCIHERLNRVAQANGGWICGSTFLTALASPALRVGFPRHF
jgi:hypothetical protein